MFDTLYHWQGYNRTLQQLIHHFSDHQLYNLFLKIFSGFIGNYMMAPIMIPLLAIIIYLNIRCQKNDQDKSEQNLNFCLKSAQAFLIMFLSFFITAVIVKLLKSYFSLPRPFCSIETELIKEFAVHKTAKCFKSFPSGHTAYITVIVASLWPIMNKLIKVLSIFTIIFVALSRVALAMHYPSDVMYTIILTVSITYCVAKIIEKLHKKYEKHTKYVCDCLIK